MKSTRVGGLAVPGARRALLFYAEKAHRDSTILRQYWLDEQMKLRYARPLVLRGPYLLQGLLRSRAHVLYQFRRRSSDSLISVVADTLGRTVAVHRTRRLNPAARGPQYTSLDLPNAPGFASTVPAEERRYRLEYRTPDMRLAWETTFGASTEIVASAADSSHLWVMVTANALSRHPSSQAVCLDLRTGKELGRANIGPTASAWVPAVMEVGAGHELLLAGYAFEHAASRARTGDLFYLRLSPEGKPVAERRTALARTAELKAARGGKVHWTLVQPEADGDVRLVGETFQSSPYSACLLRSMFSIGILGYSVLRPRDLISLKLDPAGVVHDVRVVDLRQERGSFVWPTYLQGRILADLAFQYGAFRYRGVNSSSKNMLVLRSPQQVQTLNLVTQQLTSVRQKPVVGDVDVWHVGSDFMLLYQQDAGRRTLEVERVAITAPGNAEASRQK
ncbi:hypothetical protein Q5H92_16170 [Hymenobacter sp. M29]|uniref:Uncharacterized protein n=1 Tax=Hymenobacter mellowenesis TaxID=3063995 RepID=A0ABT9ADG9_9BACT|nr:hypothetical protein [Hymenobacter sp. M29]MDO7847902.1 hypothetical protein [Hymenobacter sp. M29]